MVSHEWPTAGRYTGGHGAHFAALSRALADLGIPVTVVTGEPHAESWTHPGVRIVTCPDATGGPVRYVEPIARGYRLSRAIEATAPDVVYGPEYGAWFWRSALRSGRPYKIVSKLATSLEQIFEIEPTLDQGPIQDRLAMRAQTHLERIQTQHADALIPVSRALHTWTIDRWGVGNKPAAVIPNCVDSHELDSTREVAQRPIVVSVGRLCGWKGTDVLIRAMEQRWRAGSELDLVLAGREDSLNGVSVDQFINDNVSPGFQHRVLRTGHLSRERVLELLKSAHIATFPSRFEGFGIAALEAKYFGRPSVLTSGSGFDDFSSNGEDCLLVAPGNVDQLSYALAVLESDRERRTTIQAGARSIGQQHTAAALAPRVATYLEQVCAGKA